MMPFFELFYQLKSNNSLNHTQFFGETLENVAGRSYKLRRSYQGLLAFLFFIFLSSLSQSSLYLLDISRFAHGNSSQERVKRAIPDLKIRWRVKQSET